ncbi:MAG: hypothetical protein IBX68_00225 [Dehalococcoidia bacterium]|nr:hypothetical protein [Dehalococcoidia bacterium]
MVEESGKRVGPEVFEYFEKTVGPKVLPSLVRGLMKGVFELDEVNRNTVLRHMGSACYEGFKEFLEPVTPGVDLDTAFEWLKRTVPHERRFHRAGDTVIWDGDMKATYGGCMCLLVRMGIIEPAPELCVCSAHHCKSALEELTGIQTEAELVETVNSGADDCIYRFHLKPSAYNSRMGK